MAETNKGRAKQTFLQGALILTSSMIVVKVIGALFKIPLGAILGGDGMGYFTAAYTFYAPLYALATSGFPIAISRMVSENSTRKRFRDVRKIHKVSIPIFLITGSIGFAIMVGGAFIYTGAVHNQNAIYAILALAPTILFSCLMAIYRGYYEGMRNMFPTAISEVIEACSKLLLGLGLSYGTIAFLMNEYHTAGTVLGRPMANEELAKAEIMPIAAAAAIMGITIGSLFGFLFLILRHKIKGDGITKRELMESPKPRANRATVKVLVCTAIPIGLGAIVMNLANLIDSVLIQSRIYDIMNNNLSALLKACGGLIPETQIPTANNFLLGCFGYASSIMMLVPAITQTFGISALPSVTASWTGGDRREIKKSIESVIRITCLVAIPAGLGIAFLANPILDLLYNSASRPAEVYIASKVLTIMGVSAVFAATSTPLCSLLQAIGRVDLPVKLLSVGVLIKIVMNYVLVGIPEINIQGAGTGSLFCYTFVTAAAFVLLCRQTKMRFDMVSIFIKPLVAALFCAVCAYAAQGLLSHVISSRLATMIGVTVAVIVYVIALFSLRAITRDDVLMLPKGQKIAKILEKRKWIG